MFRHARRRKCHAISWSAPSLSRPLPRAGEEISIASPYPPCRSSFAFRSVPLRSRRRRPRRSGTLCRAYRVAACARARAGVGAGAVRAPDCPRASQAQGALRPSVPLGSFLAPARNEAAPRKPPPSTCIVAQIAEAQAPGSELFLKFVNKFPLLDFFSEPSRQRPGLYRLYRWRPCRWFSLAV